MWSWCVLATAQHLAAIFIAAQVGLDPDGHLIPATPLPPEVEFPARALYVTPPGTDTGGESLKKTATEKERKTNMYCISIKQANSCEIVSAALGTQLKTI